MKALPIILLGLLFPLGSFAETAENSAAPPLPRLRKAPRAWLGLDLAKPDDTITAHLPALPAGVGFVILSIHSNGPAVVAGLKDHDLIWKFDDQMLVNEAQLATLLRLATPGQVIELAGFRAGKPLTFKLTLGDAPILASRLSGDLAEAAIMPGVHEGPMRVVNVSQKTASFNAEDGSATVRRNGQIYQIEIRDHQKKVIFEGELSESKGLDKIPENWRRKIQVLCRTLDQALEGGLAAHRQPRPRVVPPPAPIRAD